MKETIDKYGATPSQDHSLKHIVDSFVAEGFEVAVIKAYLTLSILQTIVIFIYLRVTIYVHYLKNHF